MKFDQRCSLYREHIENYLKTFYAQFHGEPQKPLFEAMEYSLLAGGKRLRLFLPMNSAVFAAETGRMQLPWQLRLR